jgi:hypothetical protein
MVAMVQWMDSEWTGRSLFRPDADSYTNSYANTDPDAYAYAYAYARWRVAKQHARTAVNSNRR